jgi:transcriptional regulator with XRE-family HTH domain
MPKKITKPKPSQFEKSLRGTLAYNIRCFRFEKEVSQEELAFRCELDRTYISAVERCVWNVSLGNIEKIAKALEVEPWRLLAHPSKVNLIFNKMPRLCGILFLNFDFPPLVRHRVAQAGQGMEVTTCREAACCGGD